MAYIGNTSTTQSFTPAVDYFSGNGSTVAFTLTRPVASVYQVQAVIENVPQNPSDAFTVSGNTITFTSAPPSGTNNIYVQYTSPITQTIAPSQGTVAPSSLSVPNALSWDANGNVGIGTSSPRNAGAGYKGLTLDASTSGFLDLNTNGTRIFTMYGGGNDLTMVNPTAAGVLAFGTNSTERMRIDSSGRVTMPYQPAFQANYSGGNPSTGVIVFNNTNLNIGSNYSTSTGRFTAPVAGRYYFSTVTGYLTPTGTSVFIRKNGTNIVGLEIGSASGWWNLTGSLVIELAVNDYVDVYLNNTAWTTFDTGVWNSFSGYLLG